MRRSRERLKNGKSKDRRKLPGDRMKYRNKRSGDRADGEWQDLDSAGRDATFIEGRPAGLVYNAP